jgi:hypothetical protein
MYVLDICFDRATPREAMVAAAPVDTTILLDISALEDR